MVDTLRADHLGCYGYAKDTSPNIDRFADDALLFENCLSNGSNTRVSVASLLSGFLPHETGALKWPVLTQDLETLAEILQAHGYWTGAVISNFVLRKKQGYEQGFLLYDDTMEDRELVRSWPERVAEHTTDRAIEVLEKPRDRPLFLWIHYQDPHGPYVPPTDPSDAFRDPGRPPRELEFTGSISGRGGIPSYQQLGSNHDFYYYRARYDAEIRYLDTHFQRLIAALKRLGMYDNSIIVLTADHGEGMGEHDYFFAHGEYLYQDQLHVPFMLRYGNELIGRTTKPVQHVDLVPTLLKIAGIDARAPFRGMDLRGAADQDQGDFRRDEFASCRGWAKAVDRAQRFEAHPHVAGAAFRAVRSQ